MHLGRTTLSKFLIQQLTGIADSQDLGALLVDVAAAVKAISAMTAKGALGGYLGEHGGRNVQGEIQQKLDVLAHETMIRSCEWGGLLAGMASEELAEPYAVPAEFTRGRYLLVFDPLDGSSNIDVNVSVGTIFSVLRHEKSEPPCDRGLPAAGAQAGRRWLRDLRARDDAGDHRGQGHPRVHARPRDRQFHPHAPGPADSRRHQRIRDQHEQCALLGAARAPLRRRVPGRQERRARPRFQHALDRLDGRRGAPHPHARRRLHVPRTPRTAAKPGRLRLLYEANPISLLVEQAGGRATTGRQRMLEVKPESLHQRIPVILGSRHEVERIERYHAEWACGTDRPFTSPLFNERSLFRPEARL